LLVAVKVTVPDVRLAVAVVEVEDVQPEQLIVIPLAEELTVNEVTAL
jgi:hypothetical protein